MGGWWLQDAARKLKGRLMISRDLLFQDGASPTSTRDRKMVKVVTRRFCRTCEGVIVISNTSERSKVTESGGRIFLRTNAADHGHNSDSREFHQSALPRDFHSVDAGQRLAGASQRQVRRIRQARSEGRVL